MLLHKKEFCLEVEVNNIINFESYCDNRDNLFMILISVIALLTNLGSLVYVLSKLFKMKIFLA